MTRRRAIGLALTAAAQWGCEDCEDLQEKLDELREARDDVARALRGTPDDPRLKQLLEDKSNATKRADDKLDDCEDEASWPFFVNAGNLFPRTAMLHAHGLRQTSETVFDLDRFTFSRAMLSGTPVDDPTARGVLLYILDTLVEHQILIHDPRDAGEVHPIVLSPSDTGPLGNLQHMTATPDGRTLIVAGAGSTPHLAFVDTVQRSVVSRFLLPADRFPVKVAVSSDAKTIFALVLVGPSRFQATAAFVDIIDFASPAILASAALPERFSVDGHDIATSPDGAFVFVLGQAQAGQNLHFVDVRTATLATSFRAAGSLRRMAVHPDGRSLYVTPTGSFAGGIFQQSVGVVDVATAQLIANIPTAEAGSPDLAILPSGTSLFQSSPFSSVIQQIDTRLNRVVAELPTAGAVSRIAI